ncbi:OmpA family protein [Subsaximicrobium wynnwilliamsii]|uniref:OmpA family protein n=1 Tax=Subsaximicrobium wynnwilliamsii TaxID=291179 RepID=A0A5C6ZHD2_9FLAO|nr:OmpA family protein [Subsaximicrobium wynnwilliamsii]TXD83723.1 OmpA family protein [Subsaximicrobium wynnwilliamsii]TXD89393.1 OmpA family protein [Subsaximicrobium wynnwilliamsii]TXE03560.1 OmpA family protein [Subsaximicrobium wynnwilliamsii]
MKKIITLITIAALSSFSLIAQDANTKKADKHFNRFEFVDAAEDYQEIVDDGNANAYVYSQLAESYYNFFKTIEAEMYYAKALETSSEPEMVIKYSQMLKANGKYEESNVQMRKFAQMRPSDERAIAFIENPNYLPKILEKGKKFNIQNASFNTEYSDFGGTLQDGKLYITSARNTSRKTYGWNQQPFLDMYQLTKNTDGTFQEATLVEDKINTKYHEGLVSFSPDGNTMYFSRESYFEKEFEKDSTSNVKYGTLQLFTAKKDGNNWNNVQGFEMNNNNYSVKNPAVSPDGKTLYFASDMPGGFGLFDIYKASINDDGTLGEAVNLGQKVNTPGREMFPYVSSNQTLYFSSNGHLGLGGLDVFYTREIDGRMAPIRNVGIPISGNSDDFAFYLDEESGEGFVSSNREGGVGSDDVYLIKKLQPLCDVLITATITDDTTGDPIQGASVALSDKDGNQLLTKQTNAEGKVEFIVECDQESELQISMVDYDSKKVIVEASEEEEVEVSIQLEPIERLISAGSINLETIYFDFDKSNITSKAAFELDQLVQIMNKYPNLVIKATSHTDSRGSDTYNEDLSERRAKTTVQYVISKGIDASRISGIGKGETEPKVDCSAGCTKEQYQMNRRSEFIIVSGAAQEQQ